MRALPLALVALLASVPLLVGASGDKQLQNEKGSVSYQRGNAAARTLGRSASVVLADNDYAITGNSSLAAVTLPDSSRVTMGSDTRVQVAFFNQAQNNSAKFIVYQGRTRFKVEHPNGRPANYTFQTPTAQIAVRGTEGDIGVDGRNLTVNVYGLSDPNLPVVVRTDDGKSYTLHAGQQLLAKWVHGMIQTRIDALTGQAVAQFEELGAPAANWVSAVQNLPQTAVNTVAAHVPGSGLLPGISFGRHDQAGASPSPSPCPSAQPAQKALGFLGRALGVAPTAPPCNTPSPSPEPSP